MSAGIGDFRNAAQANTGALHLNAEGTGVVRQAPTSMWGKIVAWFRGAPDPGTTAQNALGFPSRIAELLAIPAALGR